MLIKTYLQLKILINVIIPFDAFVNIRVFWVFNQMIQVDKKINTFQQGEVSYANLSAKVIITLHQEAGF